MPDLAALPATPVAAPPAATDMVPMGRPPGATSPAGTLTIGYGVPLGALAPAILPKARVTAGGAGQVDATQITVPISIVTAALAGGGVRLPAIPQFTATVSNATTAGGAAGAVTLVYPPLVANGSINGLAAGAPVELQPGTEASFHTDDGVSYFVAL